MDADRLMCDRKSNYGNVACDSILGGLWRTVHKVVGVKESSTAQLVDPEIANSLRDVSEPGERN